MARRSAGGTRAGRAAAPGSGAKGVSPQQTVRGTRNTGFSTPECCSLEGRCLLRPEV